MQIEIYPEVCCEACGEIVHNHIDCPACGARDAETDAFFDLWEELRDEGVLVIECRECKTKFRTTDREASCYRWDWEVVA